MHVSLKLNLLLLSTSALALPAPELETRTTSCPYKRMVVFGDNLSDNGNGSYAHGVSGIPATIYGSGTWTNGPVCASYLSTHLGVSLSTNYAYGHAAGGSLFGATIDNSYTKSPAGAPDAIHQIKNYTSNSNTKININTTLHFLWIGANGKFTTFFSTN